jgi:hypothetical protein
MSIGSRSKKRGRREPAFSRPPRYADRAPKGAHHECCDLSFTVSGALGLVALRPVGVSREATSVVALQIEKDSRGHRRVGEVGEHAVDAEPVELKVFVDRVSGVQSTAASRPPAMEVSFIAFS